MDYLMSLLGVSNLEAIMWSRGGGERWVGQRRGRRCTYLGGRRASGRRRLVGGEWYMQGEREAVPCARRGRRRGRWEDDEMPRSWQRTWRLGDVGRRWARKDVKGSGTGARAWRREEGNLVEKAGRQTDGGKRVLSEESAATATAEETDRQAKEPKRAGGQIGGGGDRRDEGGPGKGRGGRRAGGGRRPASGRAEEEGDVPARKQAGVRGGSGSSDAEETQAGG